MKGIEALPRAAMDQIRMRQVVIAQHELVIHALESEIMEIVKSASGVDLEHEQWEIDLDRGILRRIGEPGDDPKRS